MPIREGHVLHHYHLFEEEDAIIGFDGCGMFEVKNLGCDSHGMS